MAIFNSYVSLPEGIPHCLGTPWHPMARPALEFTARAIMAMASAAAVPSSNSEALATSIPVSSQTKV